MVKEYFKELAAFNAWATDAVCNWFEVITEEQWQQEVINSFNSINKTALHIISAEIAWLERFKKNPETVWIQSTFKGTKEDHIVLWKKSSGDLKNFINEFDETRLDESLQYKRLNGNVCANPYYQLFAHVVNHSSYHRGQLVTMLRQVGFKEITATDLAGFYSIKK